MEEFMPHAGYHMGVELTRSHTHVRKLRYSLCTVSLASYL